MQYFEEPEKKPQRKIPEVSKNQKPDFSEEHYAKNKQKKQYKLKKNEIRAQELWDEWESDL